MPKLPPGIKRYESKDGRTTYQVRLSCVRDGRRQWLRATFDSLKAARDWRTEQLGRLAAGERPASQEPFGAYLTHWLDTHRLAPNSKARYASVIRRRVVPALGAVPLADLNGRQVQELFNTARNSTEAAQLSAVIHGALDLAVKEGLVSRNVSAGLRVPRPDLPRVRPEAARWTPAEVRALLDALATHPLGPLFDLAAHTGLRLGELIALEWRDISFDFAVLTVRQSKTAAGERRVPLDAGTLARLAAHGTEQAARRDRLGVWWQEHERVFERGDGRPVSARTVEALMGRTVRRLGLPHGTPHTLRHHFASQLAEAGVPLTVVQSLLGHASFNTTATTYTHHTPLTLSGAVEAFARRLAAPCDNAVTTGPHPTAKRAAE